MADIHLSFKTDKIVVLSESPYSVFERPLILKSMPEFFDFAATNMSMIPNGRYTLFISRLIRLLFCLEVHIVFLEDV